MNEYSVTVLVDAGRNFTVKAESPEAAVERAEELYSEEFSGLCHQCSRKVDVGDAVGAVVYCEDKEVLDTSYQAARIDALKAECTQLQSAMVGMIDLAHEYRHLLTQQRFPDNDEGDAFRRHRDAQVLRIERILSAAQAAKVESHE